MTMISNSRIILAGLAEKIRVNLREANEAEITFLEKSLEIGSQLIEAKAACGHGEWLPFCEKAGIHERQARRLMQLASSNLKSDTVSDLGGIKAALHFLKLRKQAVELLGKLEIPAWGGILAAADAQGVGDDGLLEGQDIDACERDMDRIMEAIKILDQMKGMFTSPDVRSKVNILGAEPPVTKTGPVIKFDESGWPLDPA